MMKLCCGVRYTDKFIVIHLSTFGQVLAWCFTRDHKHFIHAPDMHPVAHHLRLHKPPPTCYWSIIRYCLHAESPSAVNLYVSMTFPSSHIKYGCITVVFVSVSGECSCCTVHLPLLPGNQASQHSFEVTQQVGPCLNIVSTTSSVLIYL